MILTARGLACRHPNRLVWRLNPQLDEALELMETITP